SLMSNCRLCPFHLLPFTTSTLTPTLITAVFFSRLRRPPLSTLFPYTTLFRSLLQQVEDTLVVQIGVVVVHQLRVGAVVVRHVGGDRKSTRLNSSHVSISYAVFCLKKKTKKNMKFL